MDCNSRREGQVGWRGDGERRYTVGRRRAVARDGQEEVVGWSEEILLIVRLDVLSEFKGQLFG